jgi:hypothetical protein
MLIYSVKDNIIDTPAPGTETKLHTAESLYIQRLSAVLFTGTKGKIHSNFIVHSKFILKNDCS